MRLFLLVSAACLTACAANGVRTENGTVNLGPNVFGDDPIYHRQYPGYAEYAVATHELDQMAKDGYGRDDQLCFARIAMQNLPPALRSKLDEFATGEVTLMESEYAALSKEAQRTWANRSVMDAVAADYRKQCT